MHPLRSLYQIAFGIAVAVSGKGAHGAEARATILVTATVLPTWVASLSDATVTVGACGPACSELGEGVRFAVRDRFGGRALSAAEKDRLLKDGIAGLAEALSTTAASGVTIVSLDF